MKHTCHWPGCTTVVPPRLWGCGPHWRRLPPAIRRKLSETYVPGQERGERRPTSAYLEAGRAARAWAIEQARKDVAA